MRLGTLYGWSKRMRYYIAINKIMRDMIFLKKVEVKEGQKYIKIGRVSDHSSGRMGQVWGFVVNTDTDSKFKKGDLLKAAGFNAPARNAARGNVLEGGFGIRWTGPLYL